jgi:hypothetical protein
LFLMRLKVLATQCDVRVLGQEADQIVVRAPWLFGVEGSDLKRRLPDGARLGRGQIWIAMNDKWQETLERVLQAMNEHYQLMNAGAQAGVATEPLNQ